MRRPLRKTARIFLLATLLGVAAGEVAHRSGAAARADLYYFDLWHRLAGERFRPERTALVVIDEPTLAEYRDIPLAFWTPLFARASARLREAGATVIGFDFLFSASAENWIAQLPLAEPAAAQNYGLEFRNEIATAKLVLAASRVPVPGDADEFLLPAPEYVLAVPQLDIARHVALVDLISDADGGVRRFQAAPALRLAKDVKPSEAPAHSFAALIAARISGRDSPRDARERLITFAGPPGTFPSVPLKALLADGALQTPAVQALRGKAVIVGANFPGMNDVHLTPYASGAFGLSGRLMAGAEVHANIAEALIAGRETVPVDAVARLAIALLLAGGATLAFRVLSPWLGLGALALAAAATAGIGYAFFRGSVAFPAAALQAGLGAAYLAAYGSRLTREERERTRIRNMFKRYLSPQVVEELVSSPSLPELGGTLRNVTVLFSDIRNFTSISEKLSPGETVEMLNAYFEHACAAVQEHGGTLDKFIGDAIMAEFGTPAAQPDHARRALRAALAMARAAREFRGWMGARFGARGLPEFDIGVGVHTGDAIVGNIGSSHRLDYTAIGDTVNTASRLESATKSLGCAVVASRSTIEAAGPGIRTGKADRIQVKGRDQPVEVFEVLGVGGNGA